MKHTKKIISIALIAVMLSLTFTLSGCGLIDVSAITDYIKQTVSDILGNETGGSGYFSQYELQYAQAVAEGYTGTFEQWFKIQLDITNSDGSSIITTDNISAAANKALCSSVAVLAGFAYFPSSESKTSAGSGVIFYEDAQYAYIVTNYHVIFAPGALPEISSMISVYLYGLYLTGNDFIAEYVGGSMINDIAVIRIEKTNAYLNSCACVATIADSQTALPGDSAIAVGNPQGEGIAVTSGIISAVNDIITINSADEKEQLELRVLRVDTPVNPGNSGGGLFNSNGELVGIVNAKHISDDTENIGYAIPTNVAIALAFNIVHDSDGVIEKPIFGITMQVQSINNYLSETDGKVHVVQQIVVSQVAAGSAADGYIMVGDEIVSFTYNGTTITVDSLYDFADYIFTMKLGQQIVITVLRNGIQQDIVIPITNVVTVS